MCGSSWDGQGGSCGVIHLQLGKQGCTSVCGMETFPAEAAIVIQAVSHVQFFATPWATADQAPLSFTVFFPGGR